jgi:hypothetical protein
MQIRFMKWMLCLLLVIGLLVPQGGAQAATADGKVTVKVIVAGLNGAFKSEWLQVGAGEFTNASNETIKMDKPTALGALTQFLRESHTPYTAKTVSFGSYVTKIGDFEEKKPTANMGWGVWVNGKLPDVAADQFQLKDGDVVLWGFYDWQNTLVPQVKAPYLAEAGKEFTVKVTADKTTYGEDGSMKVETVPVEGATVQFTQGDEELYTTDKDGVAKVKAPFAGLNTLYVDKVDPETGTLLLMRSDYHNVLALGDAPHFTDLSTAPWAAESINYLAANGVVNGDGEGHFLPGRAVTRGELAKMIALSGDLNLGGPALYSDVSAVDEFNRFIGTVTRKGYMNGYVETVNGSQAATFHPNQSLTREELAVVLVRLAGKAPATAMHLNYSDASAVKSYAAPYVQTAFDNGLMVGADNQFRPQATASRAEVAKALVNVLGKGTVE